MKIEKKGLYRLSMEQYHGDCAAGPSISSSGLRKIFLKSPRHFFKDCYLNPKRIQEDETKAFVLGRAAHHLLLGEDAFSTLFIMRPDDAPDGRGWNGNNLSCKAWLAAQNKAGRTVLTPNQIEQIRGMARELSVHPLVRAGILNGEIEQSLVWRDKKTGIWLKSRPDAIPNDSGDFADLKGTSSIGFDLYRDVSKYRYDMQAALVKWGAEEVLGLEMASFSFVFCEFEEPHTVDVLTLGKEDISEAEKDLRSAIDTFAWCIERGNWFGPAGTQSDARYVHISEFARKTAEFRRDFLKREIERAVAANDMAEECLSAG